MPNGLFNLKQHLSAIQQRAWTGQKTPAVNYLVVAGGGAGGAGAGSGGGGAGGLLTGNIGVNVGSSITVTVGAGGTSVISATGNAGNNSVFGSITASGGGGGANDGNLPSSGGSGGGGRKDNATAGAQAVGGQGNIGGTGFQGGGVGSGGGGGGAGIFGIAAGSARAGNGGAGVALDISGTRTVYAGGGGGCTENGSGIAGTGGAGGGGAGALGTASGSAGSANTGGGGGGGGYSGASSGAGGSGIVIISYPDTYAAAASTTGSPTVSTSGSGSIYFNGSSYLTYASAAGFGFGAGNYTVEFWAYGNFASAYNTIFDNRVSSATGIAIYLGISSTITVADNSAIILAAGTISTNTWTHVAVVRNGTTITIYVNGSSVGTVTDSRTYATSASAIVGANNTGSQQTTGYISNFRVVKGIAVYTSNFTVSSVPLTSVSGTSLLLNSISGSFLSDSSGNSLAATATGTSSWNSASPFTVTGYKNRVYTWTSSGSITF